MKLKRRFLKRGRIEIIPMIDTILILLIFYMSFASLTPKEKRMDAKMPLLIKNPVNVPPVDVPLDLLVHVHDKGNVVVQGAPMDMETFRGYMTQYGAVGQNVTVVIGADAETVYQDVISALDACAQAKLQKVAFRPLEQKQAAAK
jgi:biopolymer transport protein ExbD